MFVLVIYSSKWHTAWIDRTGLDSMELNSKMIVCNFILQIKTKFIILTNLNSCTINYAN